MKEEPNHFIFCPVTWLDETPSTNTYIKEILLNWPSSVCRGMVVAARRQTAGKGRMGTVWQSASTGDLTFSFFWSGEKKLTDLGTLPMACALGVVDFLKSLDIVTRCKWPNDVLAGDRKICGILAEGSPGSGRDISLVMGVGINVRNIPERDCAVGRATASIEELTGNVYQPEMLISRLLAMLAFRISRWEESGFSGMRTAYEKVMWGVGKRIATKTNTGLMTGTIFGVGGNGELLLRRETGGLIPVSSVSALNYDYPVINMDTGG